MNGENIKLNQQVKRNFSGSWIYWVSELCAERVLIRTTESVNDPDMCEQWVDLSELRQA